MFMAISGNTTNSITGKKFYATTVNKLLKKGYVTKTRSEKDARIAIIELTAEGRKMNHLHHFFHEQMVMDIRRELTEEELDCLIRCVRKLNAFFEDRS